jgi:hypothetical protein
MHAPTHGRVRDSRTKASGVHAARTAAAIDASGARNSSKSCGSA